jgi:hypothetical protein
MSDEFDADERLLADLFAAVPAPDSLRGRWVSGRAGGRGRDVPKGGWGSRAGRALAVALIGARGERRLRPLAAALVLPVAILGAAGAMQLHAHFSPSLAGTPGNPPARSQAVMAYDPAQGVVVMFGGRGESGSLGDTWTWDGSIWRQQHPAVSPPARVGGAMAYDQTSGRLVLFSGNVEGGAENATWTWDGTTWRAEHTQHAPQGGPIPLVGMAADAATGQVVLVVPENFGLPAKSSSGSAIITVPPNATLPARPLGTPSVPSAHPVPLNPGGAGHAVTIPPSIEYPPLPETYEYSTWIWTGSDWTAAPVTHRPSGMLGTPDLVYDSSVRGLMLVTASVPQCRSIGGAGMGASPQAGGPTGGSSGWTGYSPLPAPSLRAVPPAATSTVPMCPMLIDPIRWTWDGHDWTRDGSPMQKLGTPSAFATTPDGWLSFQSGTTVTGSGPQLGTHPLTSGLKGRSEPALAGDDARQNVVLFGGSINGRPTADTWVWDGKAWTHRAGPVEPTPSPRPPYVPTCSDAMALPSISMAKVGRGVDITVKTAHGTSEGCMVRAMFVGRDPFTPLPVSGTPRMLVLRGTTVLHWSNWCGSPPVSFNLTWANQAMSDSSSAVPDCVDATGPSVLSPTPTAVPSP